MSSVHRIALLHDWNEFS